MSSCVRGTDCGHLPAPEVRRNARALGAGDAFLGGLGAALSQGRELLDAVAAGQLAAGQVLAADAARGELRGDPVRPADPIPEIDFANPETFGRIDTDQLLSVVRKDGEVFWHGPKSKPGFWCVIGHRTAGHVLRHPELFSSEHGMTVDTLSPDKDPGAGLMIEVTDPPRHRRLRRTVNELFSVSALSEHEPAITAAIERVVADVPADRLQDFVATVAEPVTVSTASILFGLDPDQVSWLVRRTCQVFLSDGGAPGARHRAAVANTEVLGWFARILAEQPRGSESMRLLSVLRQDLGDRSLSDAEVLYNCLNLSIAATQTTRNTMSGMMALLAEGDAFRRLGEEPSLVPSAVEESVRLASPLRHLAKTATTATRLGDYDVDAGDRVLTWVGAANRDPEIFADPLTFLVDRTPNPHLGFAGGPHGCAGAGVARLQMRAALGALTRRFDSVRLGRAELVGSNFLRGYDHIHTIYTERRAGLVEADTGQAGNGVPSVADLARAKGLEPAVLDGFGVRDCERGVVIPYASPDGSAARSRLRSALRGVDGSHWLEDEGPITAYWNPVVPEILQRTPTLLLVEGESDCWTAWSHRIAAIGIPGGAHTDAVTAAHVAGATTICIVVEPDNSKTYPDGVDAYVDRVQRRLAAIGFAGETRKIEPSDGLDDLNAMFRHHGADFVAAVDRWLATSSAGVGEPRSGAAS